MAFKPHLAPIKAAILLLKKNNLEIVNKAKNLKANLQKLGLEKSLTKIPETSEKDIDATTRLARPFALRSTFKRSRKILRLQHEAGIPWSKSELTLKICLPS